MVSSDLKLIRGTVQELTVYAGEEEFVGGGTQQAVGSVAAVGLAAAGLGGPAVGASMAASATDPVQYFSAVVGGSRIAGWFSKVTFKIGDEVEVLVEREFGGEDSAIAIRRPADRILWMMPHCSRGTVAHRRFAGRLFCWIFVALLVVFYGFFGVVEWQTQRGDHFRMLPFFAWLFGANALVMAAYFAIRFAQTWRLNAAQAEAVFAAFGYREPSRVDLEKDHKRACRALGEKWPYISDGPWIYRYSAESDGDSPRPGAPRSA